MRDNARRGETSPCHRAFSWRVGIRQPREQRVLTVITEALGAAHLDRLHRRVKLLLLVEVESEHRVQSVEGPTQVEDVFGSGAFG